MHACTCTYHLSSLNYHVGQDRGRRAYHHKEKEREKSDHLAFRAKVME